ncbi:hypothetical protein ACRRTK_000736 [Alexandromys fortis]
MELSSAPLHKGQLPWRGLLLAASLLIYWSSPTTAQVTVEPVPPHVAEGANVLLLVHNLPETLRVFFWYKGETVDDRKEIARFLMSNNIKKPGPACSGRERIYRNGSLLFQNVTRKDAGAYMLYMKKKNFDIRKAFVQFHVYPSSPAMFYWYFNGKILSKVKELFILNITTKNSGSYSCLVYNYVFGIMKTTVKNITVLASPTTVQVTVEAVLSHVAEVKNILLRVHNLPDTAQVFFWYKGKTLVKGNEIARFLESKRTNKTRPAYSTREKIHHSGSLLFRIVT